MKYYLEVFLQTRRPYLHAHILCLPNHSSGRENEAPGFCHITSNAYFHSLLTVAPLNDKDCALCWNQLFSLVSTGLFVPSVNIYMWLLAVCMLFIAKFNFKMKVSIYVLCGHFIFFINNGITIRLQDVVLKCSTIMEYHFVIYIEISSPKFTTFAYMAQTQPALSSRRIYKMPPMQYLRKPRKSS